MILSEFKAWFEGYTEGLEGAPTKAQFERIKEKVKEISGTPITQTVYFDRYVQPYLRGTWPYWSTTGVGIGSAVMGSIQAGTVQSWNSASKPEQFDSASAMYALGKADAGMN